MKIANKVLKTVKRAQRMYIPDKAYLHALWSGPNCPFMINAIPKSGTNLLKAIMRMFPGVTEMGTFKFAQDSSRVDNRLHYVNHVINCRKRGAMYYGHLPYDSDVSGWLMDNKIKMLLLYRDPRDVVVSRVHYIMNKGGTYTRKDSPTYDDYPLYASFKSHSERLMAAIEGFGEGKKEFKYYSGRDIPNIRVVFEEYCKWAEEDNVLSLRYEDLIADKEIR